MCKKSYKNIIQILKEESILKEVLYTFITIFNYFIVYYVVIMALWQLVQLIGSIFVIYSNRRKERLLGLDTSNPDSVIPISILAPAYNEGVVIIESVKGMLNVDYPVFEVVVINDGSTDDSLEKLIREFNLHKVNYPVQIKVPCAAIRGIYRNPEIPRLTVVDKENGGKKADACNAGINVCRYPYFINMDSDCLLDRDSLTWVARSFMNNKNCIAVSGIMRMSNGNEIKNNRVTNFRMPKNWFARFQVIEYSRSFLVGRLFTAKIGCMMVISGAFGAFHKETVINVGGYSLDSIGEDMDLVMKLHRYMKDKRYKYEMAFTPKAICWTQGPEKYKELRGQRRRWHIGLMQVMYKFRRLMLNPKYGTVGMIGMPYQFLYETVGPVIEILGCFVMPASLYLGIITPYGFLLFCTAAMLLGILISMGSLAADIGVFNRTIHPKDFMMLSFLCVAENFVFRPLTLLFRIQAIFRYSKFQHSWESISRQSFQDTKEESSTDSKSHSSQDSKQSAE